MTESRTKATLRAFRHRNYRLFFAGQMVSLVGTWMQSVAQAWLVYRLTGSAALLGIVSFASQFPIFLLAPLGGAVADSFPRRYAMIAIQAASMMLAFPLAVLTFSNRIQVWEIVVLSISLGVVSAFDIPVRHSFVVEMVGREDLMNAIALNSSMMNTARVLGPAIAGVLVAAVGEAWCFLLNGISYLAVILCLTFITAGNDSHREQHGSWLAAMARGFQFVLHNRPVSALLILVGLSSLMGTPYMVLMPIFADQILKGGARELGILMGSSGIGALFGALLLAGRRDVRGLGTWVMLGCGTFGVSLILFALSRNFWISVFLLLPVGFTMMVQIASSNTLIQTMVPDQLRGRVIAVYSMMFMGMMPVGGLLGGILANRLGAPLTVIAGGVVCIAGAVVFGLRLPMIRAEGRQLLRAQTTASGEAHRAEAGELTNP